MALNHATQKWANLQQHKIASYGLGKTSAALPYATKKWNNVKTAFFWDKPDDTWATLAGGLNPFLGAIVGGATAKDGYGAQAALGTGVGSFAGGLGGSVAGVGLGNALRMRPENIKMLARSLAGGGGVAGSQYGFNRAHE